MTAITHYVSAHKFISIVVVLLLAAGLYYVYGLFTRPSDAPRYVTTTVATGTVVASITETGQVSASSNIDILSKSSGEVLSIPVTAGQQVGAGAALAYLDPTTAKENVTSAQQALQAAQIALAKLQQPATASDITSSENSVATAQANLVQAHESGYNDISAAFLDLPNIITGLDTVLHGTTVPGRTSEQNINAYSDIAEPLDVAVVQYRTAAEDAYQAADAAFTTSQADFKSTPRSADDATVEALVTESYQAAASISDALKASTNFFNFVNTTLTDHHLSLPMSFAGHLSTLTGYTTTVNTHVATLSADTASITSDERAVAAAQASLAQLQTGADTLDIQSSQLSVQMKQDALKVAQSALADTVVRAPFAGTVAKLDIQRYETIGSGTAVATLVSNNQSVAISVNEVDAAKLRVGEKATITFDALPNVSIAGTVSSVNTIGTVSSGVVSYAAIVTFDTPNASVKPGMSATADIVYSSATGLLVPSSAVKVASGVNYVEVFAPTLSESKSPDGIASTLPPIRVNVTTGLTNDTDIIIESGLLEGAQVVTRTITGSGTTAPTSAARSTSVFGGGPPGGGVRALTR
jgi:HlyD family secretion protein